MVQATAARQGSDPNSRRGILLSRAGHWPALVDNGDRQSLVAANAHGDHAIGVCSDAGAIHGAALDDAAYGRFVSSLAARPRNVDRRLAGAALAASDDRIDASGRYLV